MSQALTFLPEAPAKGFSQRTAAKLNFHFSTQHLLLPVHHLHHLHQLHLHHTHHLHQRHRLQSSTSSTSHASSTSTTSSSNIYFIYIAFIVYIIYRCSMSTYPTGLLQCPLHRSCYTEVNFQVIYLYLNSYKTPPSQVLANHNKQQTQTAEDESPKARNATQAASQTWHCHSCTGLGEGMGGCSSGTNP